MDNQEDKCGFEFQRMSGEIVICRGNRIKHGNHRLPDLCDNKRCPRYYLCLSCGKKFGHHFD